MSAIEIFPPGYSESPLPLDGYNTAKAGLIVKSKLYDKIANNYSCIG